MTVKCGKVFRQVIGMTYQGDIKDKMYVAIYLKCVFVIMHEIQDIRLLASAAGFV